MPLNNLGNLPGFISISQANALQTGILSSDAVNLGKYLDALFINRPDISSGVYKSFTEGGLLTLSQKNINNNLLLSWSNGRLWDALKAYIGAATSISSFTSNLAQVKDTQDATFYVLYNGVRILMPALDQICQLEVTHSLSFVSSIRTVSLTISIISILLILSILVFAGITLFVYSY